MTHPRVYSNPMVFDPERFIAQAGRAAELDPRQLAFSFGRVLAEASIFISCAMSLATLNITKLPGSGGIDIQQGPAIIRHGTFFPVVDVVSLMVCASNPASFKCCIQPRSEMGRVLIQGDITT
ncbi:hypothetical protein B0H14DRAFT_2420005 [Mycena olivaceomarginata]|nr:hypothetical protein B0H14DRAFT_2420005 [Mycena olivaceomarginata]